MMILLSSLSWRDPIFPLYFLLCFRKYWVHSILRLRSEEGERQPVIKELRDYPERFNVYIRSLSILDRFSYSALCCEFNLSLTKTPHKMLAKDAKNKENESQSDKKKINDGRMFRRHCVNVIANMRLYLFFNVRKFQTQCAMTLTLK